MTLPEFIANPDPSVYLGDNYVVVDFETTNFDKGSAIDARNSVVLACWRVGSGHGDFDDGNRDNHTWGGEFEQSRLLAAIGSAAFVVAHNCKFELQWLKRCGLDLRGVLPFCTQIGQYVLHGNRTAPLSLEAVSRAYGLVGKGHFVSLLIKSGISPAEIPRDELQSYCARDVEIAEQVFLKQRDKLLSDGLLPVAYCRNIVTPCLADIEEYGMSLDPERVAETYAEYSGRYEALKAEFERQTGGINPKSPKQMREFLYETLKFPEVEDYRGRAKVTATGQKATDKHILAALKAKTPEQIAFKKVAVELAKLKTPMQNLTKMKAICEAGGRTYAQFNQTITQTHRLSSSGRKGGFQFHNFDRVFKKLFRASEGHVYCEADAPQLEFRVAGHLTGDAEIRRTVVAGEDVHALTAQVLGVSRQAAKPNTFKPLYGGMSGTPKEKKYYEAFRAKYRTSYEAQRAWTYEVAEKKQLRIASGLVFYWPDTKISDSGYVSNTPSIFNYPVQSFATADIIPLTLVLVWHKIADLDGRIVNTIHDSIVAEIAENNLDNYNRIIVECFTKEIYGLLDRLYGIKFSLPLGVGIKAARHWGEGTETKHEPAYQAV